MNDLRSHSRRRVFKAGKIEFNERDLACTQFG